MGYLDPTFSGSARNINASTDLPRKIRCEYYNSNPAATSPQKCRAYLTMWRNRRHKIIVYHGEQFGELYNLEQDPNEFENHWDDPDYLDIRFAMMKRCFDARVFAMDPMPVRVSGF